METSALSRTSAYARPGTFIKDTVQKASRGDINSSVSTDYTVSISSEGQNRSLSEFNQSQQVEKKDFVREQKTDEASNNRDIESQRRSFEREQAAEERQFESRQSMEKTKYMREIKGYGAGN